MLTFIKRLVRKHPTVFILSLNYTKTKSIQMDYVNKHTMLMKKYYKFSFRKGNMTNQKSMELLFIKGIFQLKSFK